MKTEGMAWRRVIAEGSDEAEPSWVGRAQAVSAVGREEGQSWSEAGCSVVGERAP